MIHVDRSIEINPAGTPLSQRLDRNAVWAGLVRKAENAVPFVEAITACEIVERDATGFTREIVINGETMREHIVFHPEERVAFERLSGSAMGTIDNIIEERDGQLMLRFVFNLDLIGADEATQQGFARIMETSYVAAIATTLQRIRSEQMERAEV